MSALARTNSHSKRHQYKDYVSFLDNYKTGKRDDQNSVITSDSGVNFSLTNSSNNSSNSVFSDVSDSAPRNGVKEHLENFNNRRSHSVSLEPQKPKQIVKSEVFIEIRNPPSNQTYATKTFEVQNIDRPQEVTISVSNAAKIFEKNGQSDKKSLQPSNSFSKKSSIGEISKKFEDSSRLPNANKSPPKRAASIGEVSKIFENNNSKNKNSFSKPKNFNRVPKPFQAAPLPKVTAEIKITPQSPKPAILSPKPVLSPPQFPKFTPEPHQDNVDSAFSSLSVSPSPPQSVSPPPVLFSTPPSRPTSTPPPPRGPTSAPPPPPPLPPLNYSSKPSSNGYVQLPASEKSHGNGVSSPQPVRNGAISQKITVQANEIPQQNGGTLNRNDPRMKKAVYGALRNMYGAYHDQANDYLATLPKNRVKKNNGLDDIINSIAQARLPIGPDFGPSPSLQYNGHTPSVRLKSEIKSANMDPPQCVQNAMMTKDKKPFTYTPGGIDLSEVRSPSMQRRIERNANLGGASEMTQQPPRPQHVGPLPPATLAAMRPQPQVQVFPSPPPPPPMSKSIPPPPPPPSCPLPTQKITTNENQVLERPDMTKIIPDNPMALLRKTGGPAPKKSFVEQMYEEQQRAPQNPPSPPQRGYEAQSPRYPAPVTERSAPVSPPVQQQRQPQSYQPPPQQYQPPTPPQNQYQPPQQSYQPQYQPAQPPQPQYQPSQVQQRSTDSPKSPPSYQPPIIERQPTMGRQDQAQRNVSSSVGSLYIPPLNQQQPPAQKFASPPSPPEREPQVQSPGTPTLKEAPRPWQQKNVQQQQAVPPWAKRDDEERIQSESPQPAPSQRWQQPARAAPPQQPAPQQVRQPPAQQFSPRSPAVQQSSPRSPPTQNQSSNSFPVHIEIRAVPYPQDPEPGSRTEAVYVTQPIVLQHPGPKIAPPYKGQPQQQPQPVQNAYQQPRPQVQQKPKVDSTGARIIPIQVERTPPSTPGADRGLNRQMSWGSQPTQSNSFKVIQKITRTDEDEDDDTPVTQHSARYPQEMPEQVRKMKINDGGHFKQDVQRHDEENPRYRGGYIPSRIFKLLDESVPQHIYVDRCLPTKPRGNGQPQPYVHPSEQVVPEPKKYMGSNIPSRSFKILQAMTAPSDGCANANYNEDLPYNPVYNPYTYPYYPPPYWPEYYPNYYPQEQPEPPKHIDKSSTKNGRSTPVPNAAPYASSYWNEYYPNFYPQQQSDSSSKMSDKSSSTKSGRSTPLPTAAPIPSCHMPPPYWNYMPQNMSSNAYVRSHSTPLKSENIRRPQTPKPNEYQSNYAEEPLQYPPYHMYPPYYDPYYYSYYYGYPPVMPPYPYYPSTTDTEEYSGYSSQDEMSSYNGRNKPSLKRRNSLDNSSNSVQALKQHFEVRSKSATPRITITPSFSQETLDYSSLFKGHENRDEEEEEEEEKEPLRSDLCSLRSIKSVPDISVYATECSETESSESEDLSEEETEGEEEEIPPVHDEEEILPHQLSVIYEESERGDSRRSIRPSSVASETTTIAEHHSEEEDIEDFLAAQNVKYKINMFQEATEQFSIKSSGGKTVKTFEQEEDVFTSLRVKNHNLMEEKSLFDKSKQSKSVIKKYESNVEEEITDKKHGKNTNIKIVEREKHEESLTIRKRQDLQHKEVTTKVISNKKYQENNEEWWDGVKNDDKSAESDKKEISIKKDENECDTINPKAEYVMVRVDDEIVSVKLRNKSNSRRGSSNSKSGDAAPESNVECNVEKESFFNTDSGYNRSSVYDILKDSEDTDEVESGGTLMKVDSFVSALEAIKRNSGLWDSEDVGIVNPPTIKEETYNEDSNNTDEETNENISDGTNESGDNINAKYNKHTALKEEAPDQSDESEVDFWSQIKTDEDDFKPRRQSQYFEEEDDEENEENEEEKECHDYNICAESASGTGHNETKESDSTGSRHSSFSKSHVFVKPEPSNEESVANKYNTSSQEINHNFNEEYDQTYQENIDSDSEVSSESESSEEEQEKVIENEKQKRNSKSRSKSLEPQTIKERIEALRNSIAQKQKLLQEKEEISVSVKNKISAIEATSESRSKTTSTKSSVKSFEEYSEEEEGDSGVISDISRHISDNEEFPELKKLTRYERAATHSRLFKLLQDECDIEEEEDEDDEVFVQQEDKFSKLSVRQNKGQNNLAPSRSKLSLALDKYNENSNPPQVNEKLVDELVQSLLRSRKAQVFRNMPKEKLRAAAIIILQEGIEGCESPSEEFSSLVSPLRGDTQNSTPAQTPQEFYADNNEYKQYYDSWSDASADIMPPKAFKLLQEHFGASKLGTIESILAKYPKILSNKNISKEILKHLDELSSECSSPYSQHIPQSNDVTNT